MNLWICQWQMSNSTQESRYVPILLCLSNLTTIDWEMGVSVWSISYYGQYWWIFMWCSESQYVIGVKIRVHAWVKFKNLRATSANTFERSINWVVSMLQYYLSFVQLCYDKDSLPIEWSPDRSMADWQGDIKARRLPLLFRIYNAYKEKHITREGDT